MTIIPTTTTVTVGHAHLDSGTISWDLITDYPAEGGGMTGVIHADLTISSETDRAEALEHLARLTTWIATLQLDAV